jgi:hypothetical protein
VLFVFAMFSSDLAYAQVPPLIEALEDLYVVGHDLPFQNLVVDGFNGRPKIIRLVKQDARFTEWDVVFNERDPFRNITLEQGGDTVEFEFDREGRLVARREFDRYATNGISRMDSLVPGPHGPLKIISDDGDTVHEYMYDGERMIGIVSMSHGYVVSRTDMKWRAEPLVVEGTRSNAFGPDTIRWRNEFIGKDTLIKAVLFADGDTSITEWSYHEDSVAVHQRTSSHGVPHFVFAEARRKLENGQELRYRYDEDAKLMGHDVHVDGRKVASYGQDGEEWKRFSYDEHGRLTKEQWSISPLEQVITYQYQNDGYGNPLRILVVQWQQGNAVGPYRLSMGSPRPDAHWHIEYEYW